MKKLIALLLASAMLTGLIACGSGSSGETKATTGGTDGTVQTNGTSSVSTPSSTPGTTPTTPPTGSATNPVDKSQLAAITKVEPAGEREVYSFGGTYKATYTGEGFNANVGIDYSKYDFTGSGADLVYYCTSVMSDNDKWKGKRVKYELLADDGEYKSVASASSISKYEGVLVKFEFDNNNVTAKIEKIDPHITVQVSNVTASSGAYLMLEYYSNVQILYQANIGNGSGSRNVDKSKYDSDKFSAATLVTEDNGVSYYKGYVQVTVPYVKPGNYNITLYTFGGNSTHDVVTDIPLTITDNGVYGETEFHVVFGGDWARVTAAGYAEQLVDLFYNSYSRLYYRWNTAGKAATTVQFMADPFYDGAAYSMGHEVVVSTAFANANPTAIGTHCHEITHQVQNFSMNYDNRAYFVENMANFGGHRYFHWANADGYYVQFYEPTNMGILNWTRTVDGHLSYEPYGDGSKWFLSFLDWMFPSTYNGNADVLGYQRIATRGLIDEITYRAQHGGINDYDPDLPTSDFSKLVQQISNGEFQTYEDVRLFYVLQLITYAKDNGKVSPEGLNDPNSEISKLVKNATKHNGGSFQGYNTYTELYNAFATQMKNYKAKYGVEGWCFNGFGDYTDNFITEDLPYTENSNYPTIKDIERGTVTGPRLDTPVTEGDNLVKNATIVKDSGIAGSSTAAKLIDGNKNTQWLSKKDLLGDPTCAISGIAGYVILDLGEEYTFDTYTLFHTTSKNPASKNATDWELLVSDDGVNWRSVDTQAGMGQNEIESYRIPSTTARYVMLRVYPLSNGVFNFSFYEFMLFQEDMR